MKPFVRPPGIFGTFVKGYRYRARRELLSSNTLRDEILIFVGGGQYSPYDDCWIYTFKRERDGFGVCWFLHQDSPFEKPREDLEELGPP